MAFASLQERLGPNAPGLSKQLQALQEVGYVKTSKTGRGPGSVTWVTMTRRGLRAYESHAASLRALLDGGATTP